jgi:phage terminase large subunit-like protein
METGAKCVEKISIDDFHGQNCVFSIDLASRIDLTAFLQIFSEMRDGKRHYTAFSQFYLPEETVYQEHNAHYQRWVNEEWITATDGEEIDFNVIEQYITDEMSNFAVSEVVYDPWRASQLGQSLASQGATAVEYRNNKPNMSAPMYELEAAIESGRFHYDGNPVLTWMFSNVVAKIDSKEFISCEKERSENKIDGVVALIMAVGRLMGEAPAESVYEKRGLLAF